MNKLIKVATNIKWDVDDIRDLKDLPLYMEIPDDIADDEDQISDYLSEQTGFCHCGFMLIPKNKVEATDHDGLYKSPMTEEEIEKRKAVGVSSLKISINNGFHYFELNFGCRFVPLSMCNTIVTYLQYLDANQLSDFIHCFVDAELHRYGQLPIFKKTKFDHETSLRVIDYLESIIGEYYRATLVEHLKNEAILEMGKFEDSFKKVLNEKNPKGVFFYRLLNESSVSYDIFKYLKKSLDSMFISDLKTLAFTEGREPVAMLYAEFKNENIKLKYDDSSLEIVAIKNNQKRED